MIRDRIANRLDTENSGSNMRREWAKRARISSFFDCEQRGHKGADGAKVTHFMENSKLAVTRGLMDAVDLGASGFQVLRPLDKVVANHLAYFVMSQAFCKKAAGHMTGAFGLQRVPAVFLADAQLPLVEQRRIVAKNEKQYTFHGVDVANLQRVLTLRVLVFFKPF